MGVVVHGRIALWPALLGLLATLLLLLVVTGTAAAIPPGCENPDDCPPIETSRTTTLTVTQPPGGSITATNISCPGDCSESYSWTEVCYDTPGPGPNECDTSDAPSVELTASRGVGWAAVWDGCGSTTGNQCTVSMTQDRTVSVTWQDTANPTVSLIAPAAKAGPSTVFTASASDNNFIQQVTFYIDGVQRGTDSTGPYQLGMSSIISLYSHGTTHELKVVATDASGRVSSSVADAPAHSFEVDRSTGLATLSTPAAFVQSAPTVTFTRPGDVAEAGVRCRTDAGSASATPLTTCPAPYTPDLGPSASDGLYTVTFRVQDDVGNVSTVTRTFTLDRGDPSLAVGSPADGAVLGAPFTPSVTVSDAFTPTDQIVVQCRIDTGAFGSCASLAPADGSHTLTVRATDLAGNTSEDALTFTYDATAPTVTITEGPAEDAVIQSSSTTFRFTVADLTTVTRTCKVDDGAFTVCTASDRHDLSGLGVGVHTFTVRAVDAAGNVTEVERTFAVTAPPGTPSDTDGAGAGTQSGAGGGGPTGGAGPTGAAGPTGTGGGSAETGGGQAAAPLQVQVTRRWRVRRGRTKVLAFTVRGLTRGATVVVTCSGRACPFRSRTRTATGATLNLRGLFRGRALRPGVVITVRVTSGGRTGLLRFTTRTGSRAPATSTPVG